MIFISELAYSLHLGSDKNRKNISREKAKTNNSGTTSLPNSAIQNASHLTRVDKHNYRKYDNKAEDIVIVRGTTSLVDDVKNLYKQEFQKSVDEYNNKQVREDRKIKDYFTNVSNNTKNDLACEIIIELGDKKYWDTKDKEFKKKMTNVFIKQVNDLELLVPNFKIASAIIHYDETSPHMHIVGVQIKYKNKYGQSIQVGKSDVFTKVSLRKLQDKMRILCIESFNQEYNQNSILKDKKKGRNKDFLVSEMDNYQEMVEELDKHQDNLNKANEKSIKLDNNSNEIKDIVENLKNSFGSKGKYVLTKDDKDKLLNYIDNVNDTNNDYKNMKRLSNTLNNVDKELKENRDIINNTLTENNEALNLRVNTLTNKLTEKEEEIDNLTSDNNNLKSELTKWKNKFLKIINFIKNRLLRPKDKDKYKEFTIDLYTHNAIDQETFDDIKNNYSKDKRKDDFER